MSNKRARAMLLLISNVALLGTMIAFCWSRKFFTCQLLSIVYDSHNRGSTKSSYFYRKAYRTDGNATMMLHTTCVHVYMSVRTILHPLLIRYVLLCHSLKYYTLQYTLYGIYTHCYTDGGHKNKGNTSRRDTADNTLTYTRRVNKHVHTVKP